MAETYKRTTLLASSVMFNHLVIEKVLEFLDIPELKNFRLVCKLWNDLGTPFLARKVDIALEGNKLEEFLDVIDLPHSSSILMFTSFTFKLNSLQSINKAISKMWFTIHFNIKYLHLHVTTFYVSKELKRLLLLHFPCLASLKLVIMKYWGTAEVSELDKNEAQSEIEDDSIHPNVNLKSFQLSYLGSAALYGYSESADDEFHFPLNWKSFFQRFPELHHMGLTGLSSLDVGKMLDALFSFQMETSYQTIKSLEILDENIFPESPNDEHLLQMGKLQNKFESIHLEISPHSTISLLNDFLKKNANSIKRLRLRRYPHLHPSLPITLTDSNLNKVKFLEVSEDLLPSLSFLPYMPALERLHIIIRDYRHLNCCSIIHNTTNPSRIVHSGVKLLYIEPPLISKECITKLSTALPGLESLKIRVNDEMLREICSIAGQKGSSSWKSLKSLHITSWDGLTDEGITGICEPVLNFWGGFSSNVEIKSYRSNPFIGDIPDLKSLTIEMWSDYDNHVSDWSVLYGIVEVESLQEVTFVRCGISPTAFSYIPIANKFIID